MANNPQNPQNPQNEQQQKAQKSEQGRFASDKPGQDRDRPRNPQDRERYAQSQQGQQGQSANPGRGDESMVGKDTDGDGKVVKPGQKPGQSHGHGLPENKPGYEAGKKH
jgi:hypothetical protein